MSHSDGVFNEDELSLVEVSAFWSEKDLLRKKGIFYLKDVLKILVDLDTLQVKRKAREIEKEGGSPWEVMGVRKIWKHWVVRMTVFAPYYRKHLVPKTRKIEPHWDGNILLEQKGVFLLSQACRILPFSVHQLRYQAKLNPNAKKDYGIWKDKDLNVFVVDMERFGPWIKSLWRGEN